MSTVSTDPSVDNLYFVILRLIRLDFAVVAATFYLPP